MIVVIYSFFIASELLHPCMCLFQDERRICGSVLCLPVVFAHFLLGNGPF